MMRCANARRRASSSTVRNPAKIILIFCICSWGRTTTFPSGGKHDLFAAQEIKKAVAASYDSYAKPKEEALVAVYNQVNKSLGKLDTIAKLGTYLKAIQTADARFTGRAIKGWKILISSWSKTMIRNVK